MVLQIQKDLWLINKLNFAFAFFFNTNYMWFSTL